MPQPTCLLNRIKPTFFLARLADLWLKGERFLGAAGQSGRLQRSKYVIDTFVQREATEKWVGRDQKPILSLEGHIAMLGAVAEEMWRAGAFRLSKDELELSAEIGLAESRIANDLQRDILSRLPTHATLLSRDRWFSFLHDMFLHYFFGTRLAVLVRRGERANVKAALESRELTPQIVEWLCLALGGDGVTPRLLVDLLNGILAEGAEGSAASNSGHLSAARVKDWTDGSRLTIAGHLFSGEEFKTGHYRDITFARCNFWEIDLRGSAFENCVFDGCSLGDVLIDRKCSLKRCRITGSRVTNLDVSGERSFYAPDDIAKFLTSLGALVETSIVASPRVAPSARPVREDVVRCIGRFVKASERTTDVAVEDIEEVCGPVARTVAKIAIKCGVLREVNRSVSGPRKTFVRFRVDKQKAMQGQAGATRDAAVDLFWDELQTKFAG